MANRLKRNLALSGISSRCYTVDAIKMIEQFKPLISIRSGKRKRINRLISCLEEKEEVRL